ncbi:MAG: hypothetical protein HYT31_04820 [Parcubacteria group bacterium]|nr:hypothetical protein [Parcubacteria group bacterium]
MYTDRIINHINPMIKDTTINIRTNAKIKKRVAQKARERGLTLSGLTNLFFQNFVQNEQTLIDKLEERMFDNALQSAPIREKLTRSDSALEKRLAEDAKDLARMHFDDLPSEDEWVAIQPSIN